MGLLGLFRKKTAGTAQTAKERLRIIVAQERAQRNTPDYLPVLKREILEVIRRYVQVDSEAIQINVEKDNQHEVLELNITLPTDEQ